MSYVKLIYFFKGRIIEALKFVFTSEIFIDIQPSVRYIGNSYFEVCNLISRLARLFVTDLLFFCLL